MERLILTTVLIISGAMTDELLDQCALRGTSVVLKCKYNNLPEIRVLSIKWYKFRKVADELIPFLLSDLPSPNNHYEYMFNHQNDCSLRIKGVQFDDEGEYVVVFVTKFKEVKSQTHRYLSVKELTAVVQPSTVAEGDTVRLTCVTGCPEQTRILWMREGVPVTNEVFQTTKEDAGRYYCAVSADTTRSAPVTLTVLYPPMNITVSVTPEHAVEGSSINLTCSCEANPAADTYTWYRRTLTDSSSPPLRVGSGKMLSLVFMREHHSGLYFCNVRSKLGETNSTEVMLAMPESSHDRKLLQILVGIGVSLSAVLLIVLLLFWKARKSALSKKTVADGAGESNSDPNAVYANVTMLPLCPLPDKGDSHQNASTSSVDEVSYSTLNIKCRQQSSTVNVDNSRGSHDSRFTAEGDNCVVYATVKTS